MSRRTTTMFSAKVFVLVLGLACSALSHAGQPQQGLTGSYFNNTNLTPPAAVTRVDANIDIADFVATPPPNSPTGTNFSVRWSGFVVPSVTGDHLFQTRSDDGVRLFINGVQVINNFDNHGAEDDTTTAIALTAGQPVSIVLEYFQGGGGAEIRLRWQPPGTQAFVAIPSANLSTGPFANAQSVTTPEDMPIGVILTGNPPTSQFAFAIVTQPANGTVNLVDSTATYTPNANFSGTDSFTFTVNDGTFTSTPATVTITVTPANDGPPVTVDDVVTTNGGVPIQIDILGNDTAIDLPLTVSITSAPANGSVSLNTSNIATYTPISGFFGTNTFTYQITDLDGETATGTVTINVISIPPQITSPLNVLAISGVPFTYTITAIGTRPMVFTVSALPPGLTFDGTTISGVPTSNGSFSITLTATGPEASDQKTLVFGTIVLMPNVDTDQDGITDEIEVAFGSNATDALSTPFGLTIAGNPPPFDGVPFHIQQVRANVRLNFRAPKSDKVQLSGTLPIPPGRTVAGNTFGIAFGGVVVTGVLDLRGKFISPTKSAKVAIGAARANRRGTNARFSLNFVGAAAAALADEGLTNANVDGTFPKVRATVILVQSKLMFETDVFLLYKARQGVKGSAKAIPITKVPQQP